MSIPNSQLNGRTIDASGEKELKSVHIKMKSSTQSQCEVSTKPTNQTQFHNASNSVAMYDEQQIPFSQAGNIPIANHQGNIQIPHRSAGHSNRDSSSVAIEISCKGNSNHNNHTYEQQLVEKNHLDSEDRSIFSPPNSFVRNNCTLNGALYSLIFSLILIGGIVLLILTEQIWLLIIGIIFYIIECILTEFTRIFYLKVPEQDFNELYNEVLIEDPSISVKAAAFIVSVKPKKQPTTSTLTSATTAPATAGTNTAAAASTSSAPPGSNAGAPNIQSNQTQQPKQVETNKLQNGPYLRVREEVFSEQKSFDFKSSTDFSHPLQKQSIFFQQEGIFYVDIIVHWKTSNDDTRNAFLKLKNEVIANAKSRSNDIEQEEIARVVQFPSAKKYIVYRPQSLKAKLFNITAYTLFSIVLLSFPYRIYYLNSLKTLKLNFAKKIEI